ncbi:TPA: hypothetical protein ACH3X1_003035 [Trebouxia sp. C0004]
MGGVVEQQALKLLSDKQDGQLASLIHSQPVSAIAAHISLDTLARAGLPESYITLLQADLVGQQTDLTQDESPALALHRLIADMSDKETVFVSEVVAAMQLNGMSLNQPNTVQDTPLHLAARSGQVQLCQLLVQHGADPLARNNKNRYAFAAVQHGVRWKGASAVLPLTHLCTVNMHKLAQSGVQNSRWTGQADFRCQGVPHRS